MIKYVVTNVIQFKLDDDKRFNTPGKDKIVCGIFDTRIEAKRKNQADFYKPVVPERTEVSEKGE